MHSGRTLAIESTRQVKCVVQSIFSTIHSYTESGKLTSSKFVYGTLLYTTILFWTDVEQHLTQHYIFLFRFSKTPLLFVYNQSQHLHHISYDTNRFICSGTKFRSPFCISVFHTSYCTQVGSRLYLTPIWVLNGSKNCASIVF